VRGRRRIRRCTIQYVQGFILVLLLFNLVSCSSSDAQLEKMASQLNRPLDVDQSAGGHEGACRGFVPGVQPCGR
jgi:hypothetical protein